MKTRFFSIILGILLLAACTPTTTSTPVAVTPTTSTTVDLPTPAQADTPTPTPASLPQGGSIVVTNTSDSGPGSLRGALLDAQPHDTITFDPAVFPPDAPVTIFVGSEELPHIRVSNLALDASNAGVILDGSQVPGDWVAGLQIVMSEANTIMGLQIWPAGLQEVSGLPPILDQ